MSVIRLGAGALRKVRSGGGESFAAPGEWITTSYGSGWPIAPVTVPRDTEMPRTIDYPISVNATLTPRTGYGLMPFAALKECYENVTEVRMPVNLIWRELTTFNPRLVDDEDNEIGDHPYQWMCESPDRNVPFNIWMTRLIKSMKVYDAPAVYFGRGSQGIDALHYIDGSTLFLIIDEYGNLPRPETLQQYAERLKSQTTTGPVLPSFGSLIDGTPTTLQQFAAKVLKLMSEGKPVPDKVPAFTQIIKGTPFSWWSSDQIWYMPQSRRMDSPYGESFIEQAWTWIMMIVNISAFELGHYKTGTMPEGFVTVPLGMFPTLNKINAFELAFDSRMSANSPVERSRLRMFPDGSKWIPTKKPDFPAALYKQAWDNILHTIGIPPSEFGDIPGSGLGGKGFKEGAASDLSRNTLNPHREFINALFNYVLEKDGVEDARFSLDFPLEEIDPDKQRQAMYEGMAHGTLSLNDAVGQLGLDPIPGSMDDDNNPIPDHIANKHLIVAGSTIYVIEDMQVNETGMAIPTISPQQANQAGGVPIGPETVVQQDGAEHTPEDKKTLDAAIQNIRERGTLGSKTTSIPSDVTPKNVSKVYDNARPGVPPYFKDKLIAAGGLVGDILGAWWNKETHEIFTSVGDWAEECSREALRVVFGPQIEIGSEETPGRMTDPNWIEISQELFDTGMVDEAREHPDLSSDLIAQLVYDHLRTDPGYYRTDLTVIRDHRGTAPENRTSDLFSQLDKHCGVCPEDDEYFGAPIAREVEFSFPDDGHANDVEVVAMTPDGLPPKPALWKPEGGELDVLQSRVGGPQYVREEAAYLLDRSLGFYLVPVAYVAEADGEVGAAIYYSMGAGWPETTITEYGPVWVERAAVLDYIMSQTDRGYKHNYLTHPDDPTRMILIDNGLGFPEDEGIQCDSPFCSVMNEFPLSPETLAAIKACLNDIATWRDIAALIGGKAAGKARACAQELFDNGRISLIESYALDELYTVSKAGRTEGGAPKAETRERHAVLSDGRFPIWDKKSAIAALGLRGNGTTEAERKKIIDAAAEFVPEEAQAAREADKEK